MDKMFYLELFGYLGSALVVISILMTSVVKLRIFNAAGSLISATYAFIIGSLPLALMNVCLLGINIWNLMRLMRVKASYTMAEGRGDDGYVAYFLQTYGDDMHSFFPKFDAKKHGAQLAFIVCCNQMPVGLVLGNRRDDVLDVVVDYTIPAYRDCSVAAFLYPALQEKGYKALRFDGASALPHMVYLKKMGFEEEGGVFIKKLR